MKLGSKFRFSFCCCVSRRSGTLVVGIIDVLVGILCILATVALLAQNLSEQSALNELEMSTEKAQHLQQLIAGFVLVLIACGIPSMMTLVTGVVSIYATTTGNTCVSSYSVAMNFLLVIGLIGTDIFLFCLGLRMSLLIVYLTATILQIYFGLIVFDFYKVQQKSLRGRTNEEETTLPDETRKLAA